MTVKSRLWQLLDSCGPRLISGWQLHEEIKRETGRWTYPATLLQMCREYADFAGAVFKCVDRTRSVYRYEPGAKIAGAHIDRR